MRLARGAAQLLGTLTILALVPGNVAKVVVLVALWGATFARLRRAEVVVFVAGALFFDVMNVLALRQGVFRFLNPDILGMPWYELGMWGFYLVHTARFIGGPAPERSKLAWGCALLYATAFAVIGDTQLLSGVAALLLGITLWRFHAAYDLAYTAYMIVVGALVEYTGVLADQWSYPHDPFSGVPLPFMVVLWGGVGLFLRRLVLPLMAPSKAALGPAELPRPARGSSSGKR